jgi:hypothetical protein
MPYFFTQDPDYYITVKERVAKNCATEKKQPVPLLMSLCRLGCVWLSFDSPSGPSSSPSNTLHTAYQVTRTAHGIPTQGTALTIVKSIQHSK